MVLEELAHSNLIVECHTADEYAQIDTLLKEFSDVDFDNIGPVAESLAQSHPYYYVRKDHIPGLDRTLADAFYKIGDVPWMTFTEFMTALEMEESAQEEDLESVSLEDVL